MLKHNPGPWRVHESEYGHWSIESSAGHVLAEVRNGSAIRTTWKANARLISAAPNMLKVLKEIVFRANLCPEDQWIEDKALEAIAEAEGKR